MLTNSNRAYLDEMLGRGLQAEVEIPFDSVRQVKSSFSQIKLGLNWTILIQEWARIAINKSSFVICLKAGR
jgi:hypothetical protein